MDNCYTDEAKREDNELFMKHVIASDPELLSLSRLLDRIFTEG